MEAPSNAVPPRNGILHYLAIMKAAREFGLGDADIEAVAGRFDARQPRCAELADAFADLILARSAIPDWV